MQAQCDTASEQTGNEQRIQEGRAPPSASPAAQQRGECAACQRAQPRAHQHHHARVGALGVLRPGLGGVGRVLLFGGGGAGAAAPCMRRSAAEPALLRRSLAP